MLFQHDRFSNKQLPMKDSALIQQHRRKLINHPYREISKAPSVKSARSGPVDTGDLINIHTDRNKTCVPGVATSLCLWKVIGVMLESSLETKMKVISNTLIHY